MTPRTRVGRLLASYAFTAIAIGLPWPLLLLLVWQEYADHPHAALVLGLTGAARMLPYVLLSWAAGSIGDRVPRDRLIRATLVLRLVLLVACAVAVAGDHVLVAVLAASLAVACGTPAYPALAAALPGLAGADRRRATDTLVTIEVSAWAVGPALGGVLLLPATRAWLPLVACLLVGIGLALLVGVRIPEVEASPTAERGLGGMLRSVRDSRPVVAAMAVAGLLNLVLAATAIALLPLTQDVWAQGETGFGIATAWLGFGALAAPLLWWVHGSSRSRQARGMLAVAVALVLVALLPAVLAVPVLAVTGACAVFVEGSATEAIQDGVADEHRAGALGLADAVMVGSALVGSLAAPVLTALVDPRALLGAVAAGCLMVGLVHVRSRVPALVVPPDLRIPQRTPDHRA